MSQRDPGDLMLHQSLLSTGRSLLSIGERCDRGDFLTRRLLAVATKELGRACCSNIELEDLERAYISASPEHLGDLTRDQHTCRYLAEVLRLARTYSRQPRQVDEPSMVHISHPLHPAARK